MPLAAALEPGQLGQRQPGLGEVAAHRLDRAEHGERVRHPMLARLRDGEGQLGLGQQGGDQRAAARRRHDVAGADVGALAEAEGEDRRGIGPGRRGPAGRGAGCRYGTSAVPPSSSPWKISPLASAISSSLAKNSRWAGAIAVTIATCGPHQPGQRGELAGMVHPHLEHAEARLARHPGERQRHAGMVVVALHRAVRPARRGAVERREQRLLGPGLADRAGDSADPRAGAGAARRGRGR